jgi:hypothetical protein
MGVNSELFATSSLHPDKKPVVTNNRRFVLSPEKVWTHPAREKNFLHLPGF